jgi:superfamily II helicase
MTPLLLSLLLSVLLNVSAQSQEIQDSDLKDAVINMKQENHCGCIDCCPEYSVSILGDGTVTYEGIAAVRIAGKQVYSIQQYQVKNLVNEFYKVDFFSLKDKYTSKDNGDGTISMIDHTAPVTISITIKGKTKKVYNFYGAPEKLEELEKKIYEISGIDVYVKRT